MTANGWSNRDWYREGEGQVHFFPGPKRILWVVGKKIVAEGEAWGGERPQKGFHYDKGQKPNLTTPGTYVIYAIGPYTTKKWSASRIAWGTALRVAPDRIHLLYATGKSSEPWQRIDLILPGLDVPTIKDMFWERFHSDSKYDANRDGVPDTWVFNDFGPISIRYFIDTNRNRKLDPSERSTNKIMGEMVHTTPDDEHSTDIGEDPKLQHSHGCIHMKPADRTRFITMGAFKIGGLIVTHRESEPVPSFLTR